MLLHWSVALMLLMMVKGGAAAPALRWTFVAAGGLWVGLALIKGLQGRPGPKLTGAARAAFVPFHILVYATLALTVALNGAALLGWTSDSAAWTALLALLALATFHAIFHLWRHTALNDGALRVMMPRIWHKYL
jgi:cytochrome b561